MVVSDPAGELLGMIQTQGDPGPSSADIGEQHRAELIRRRFGLALPPPFVGPPGAEERVRAAVAQDGPAIAAVKWRAFGTSYRGVLADAFLDRREVVPPPSFWVGRAIVPPSRRHRLLVWGRPGTVYGYADIGPAHPDELDDPTLADATGEIHELYVDPSAQRQGGGRRLLEAAQAWLAEAGFEHLELAVIADNAPAQAFYRDQGWEPTGGVVPVHAPPFTWDELRYRRTG